MTASRFKAHAGRGRGGAIAGERAARGGRAKAAACAAGGGAPGGRPVVDFQGKDGLVVRDGTGALRTVVLHPGTVITPTGLRLQRGMQVTVTGSPGETAFFAEQIDAPYPARSLVRFQPSGGPGLTSWYPNPWPADAVIVA